MMMAQLIKVLKLEHGGHDNRGMSASRNLGVRNAKGKYICYLDGDDVWLPNMLEKQLAILQSQPQAAMVSAPLQLWFSWTGNPEDMYRDTLYGLEAGVMHPYGDTLVRPPKLLNLFLRDERFIPSSVFVRRDVIENVGGYEDVFRDGFSDAIPLRFLYPMSACTNIESTLNHIPTKHGMQENSLLHDRST